MAAGESPLIQALRQAVRAAPDRAEFRTALAEALLAAGDAPGAIVELGEALRIDPGSGTARDLMLSALAAAKTARAEAAGRGSGAAAGRAATGGADGTRADAGTAGTNDTASTNGTADTGNANADTATAHANGTADTATAHANGTADTGDANADTAAADTATPADTAAAPRPTPPPAATPDGYDWAAAEAEMEDVAPLPRYSASAPLEGDSPTHDVERPAVTLADVGGLAEVKDRLEVAFLAPMRNPELRKLYGKSLRGGLLLYGPPGCGKTFVARAVAGELGAAFVSVGIADVLDMWIGASEHNLRELFELARRKAPCVLFFDEVDALGQRRSQLRNNAVRTTVNQFLAELDSADAENDGVFVLGATNSPWDVDPALRRPGRFDRTVLVLPPDAPARAEILAYHLRDRPIAGIDLAAVVARTDGFSGADLAHLCETAAERALLDSVRSGQVRMIGMTDVEAALAEVKPSTGPWFDAARSVALFANEGGAYDDLADYFKKNKTL